MKKRNFFDLPRARRKKRITAQYKIKKRLKKQDDRSAAACAFKKGNNRI